MVVVEESGLEVEVVPVVVVEESKLEEEVADDPGKPDARSHFSDEPRTPTAVVGAPAHETAPTRAREEGEAWPRSSPGRRTRCRPAANPSRRS